MQMMTPPLSRLHIVKTGRSRKDILPAPVAPGHRGLPLRLTEGRRVRQDEGLDRKVFGDHTAQHQSHHQEHTDRQGGLQPQTRHLLGDTRKKTLLKLGSTG